MSVEKLDNVSHWTVEYTKPQTSSGRTWAANGSTEVVAADIHRALAIFCDAYPDATVHVVRKTSRFRSILIDRVGDVHG
jgi:hypothetical protein